MLYDNFVQRFEAFKKITAEEYVIASIVKGATGFNENSHLLDIGGGSGFLTSLIQPDVCRATIVDIKHYGHHYPFIEGKWEELSIHGYYDLVLMSHVYGKFERAGTLKQAFHKAKEVVHPNGYLALCYNQAKGKTADILKELTIKQPEGLIDFFDESLLPDSTQKIPFSVQIKANDFDELAEYVQVLFELPDDVFNKSTDLIKETLEHHLSRPYLEVQQNVAIIKNYWGLNP